MKTISKELQKTKQSYAIKVTAEHKGHKIRFRICSDSYANQCFARAEIWSNESLKWNLVDSIHYSNMKTEQGLAYKNVNKTGEKDFDQDLKELKKKIKDVLG